MKTTLMERAQQIENQGAFLGGPIQYFEVAGRKLLMLLLNEGLLPDSKVLDIGCGCLRGGYWLLHFLAPGCYCGIEPNRNMLDLGLRVLLEPGLADFKGPRFDGNAGFDFTVFDEQFDYVVARAIWVHASKVQIQKMLDEFVRSSRPGAVFLTSYLRPIRDEEDYQGADWVGRSHLCDQPATVRHRFDWIEAECARRGMIVKEITDDVFNFGDQRWLRIQHTGLQTASANENYAQISSLPVRINAGDFGEDSFMGMV